MTSPALFRPKAVGAGLVVNALTKYIGGHGNALAGSITDTGLFDWTRYPNIAENYKSQPPAMWGIQQIRKKGLRDLGRHAGRRRRASHRGRRRDARAADGAHVRECAGACRVSRVASAGCARCTTRACRRTRSMRSRGRSSAAFGGLFAFELADGIDCFDFLNRLEIVVSSSNLGDNRTLAIPVAHTIFWEMGAERRAAMGIADALIRISVGIEDRDDLIADFTQALATA